MPVTARQSNEKGKIEQAGRAMTEAMRTGDEKW